MTYGFDENKNKIEVYSKNDFVEIAVNVPLTKFSTYYTGYKIIDFPEGFTMENTFVLSSKVTSLNEEGMGSEILYRDSHIYNDETMGILKEVDVTLYNPLGIEDEDFKKITITCNSNEAEHSAYRQVKLILIKK